MKNTKRNIIILGSVILLISLALVFVFQKKEITTPSNLISAEQAGNIIKDILGDNENGYFAYLWPEVLKPGDGVEVWGDRLNEEEMEEGETMDIDKKIINNFYWFVWIDKEPGNIFFGHDVEYIYIDAQSGEYIVENKDFWPYINGESFEGDMDTMINTEILSDNNISIKKFLNSDIIKDFFAIEARAREAGKYLHINSPKEEYQHEHYAMIISGFGKNDWVFLDGVHQMYNALKEVGYDDNHIVFLAPIKGVLNSDWDREADFNKEKAEEMNKKGIPKFVASNVVDELTSPINFRFSIEKLQKDLKPEDSLFVFVLSHGKKNQKFALGEPVDARQAMGSHDKIRGSDSGLTSKRFSEVLMRNMKICELMVLIDSCYAGAHENRLRYYYDKYQDNIKRMEVAHSTNDETISYGADYRNPSNPALSTRMDLDQGAKETAIKDLNPNDHGGEFSSGFIENIGANIFSMIYEKGVELDAAQMNKLTFPYIWKVGSDEECIPLVEDIGIQPEDPLMTDSQDDEPQTEPAAGPVAKKEMISVIKYGNDYIPFNQLKVWSKEACNCCDEAHYHSVSRSVTTLSGKTIVDPYAGCGFGKISESPVIQIEKP